VHLLGVDRQINLINALYMERFNKKIYIGQIRYKDLNLFKQGHISVG